MWIIEAVKNTHKGQKQPEERGGEVEEEKASQTLCHGIINLSDSYHPKIYKEHRMKTALVFLFHFYFHNPARPLS